MPRLTITLFLLLSLCLGANHKLRAATTVEVVSTDPAGEVVTLERNRNFYLHLRYQSDEPVQIWARPYFQGEAAKAGSNPSRLYPAGSGEALGWFFLFEAGTQVDEVRISAGDGTLKGTPVVAVYPVSVNGGYQAATTPDAPEWVNRLSALDKAAQQADYERRMSEPMTASDIAWFNVFMLGMFAIGLFGFIAPAWGLWRWRGRWRMAAAVPAALMAFVVVRLLIGTAVDPTSHNLWPFEILITGALSVVIMIAAVVARKVTGERE